MDLELDLSPNPWSSIKLQSDTDNLAVTVGNVNYSVNGQQILHNLNLSVERGDIYSLLGPSGCGKTTLLRCLIGFIKPQKGAIRIFGMSPHEKGSGVPGIGLGYMPQDLALQDFMTIEETLTYFGNLLFIDDKLLKKRIDNLITSLDLPEKKRLVANLSGGQKRRVSFALTVLHKPRLLILDEPTVGCDPILRERIWNSLKYFSTNYNMTIIITTHYIDEARQSDRVGFMRDGVVLKEDNPETLISLYHADSLEAVFLRICEKTDRKPSFYRQKSNVSRVFQMIEPKPITKTKERLDLKLLRWYYLLTIVMARIILQIKREPEALIIQFILPLFSLMCFCMFVSQIPYGVNIGIVNNDLNETMSSIYFDKIDSYYINQIKFNSIKEAQEAAKRREIYGFLEIERNFTTSIVKRLSFENIYDDEDEDSSIFNNSTIKYHADVTNWPIRLISMRIFEVALIRYGKNITGGSNEIQLPIALGQPVYGKNTEDFAGIQEFASIGVMVILSYTIAYGATLLVVIEEKVSLIFERHFAAGISTTHILLGHLIARFILQSILAMIVFLIAITLFNVSHVGSIATALALILVHSITGCAHGLFQSSVSSNISNAVILGNASIIFLFAMSGVLWPYEALPKYVRWLAVSLPVCLPTESLRAVLLKGWSISNQLIVKGFGISIIWAAFFLLSSIYFFRYK